ncbi:hypothetical protein BJ878DRAFT_517462 [Calycina marina]|uniref:Thaumatin-like protein n=1 Tax=Calycina marina TaxID=1763456 RepID=A0A9P7YYH6_9HELO|nr:hypothetical protein BJ878DRAFT_517462 [Calycina marina]
MVSFENILTVLSVASCALAGAIPVHTATSRISGAPSETAEPSKHAKASEITKLHPSGVNHVGADKAKATKLYEAADFSPGAIKEPPHLLTITVINSQSVAITTEHSRDPGAPSAVSGHLSPGTMSAGETASFAVPTNWIGNVAVANAEGSDITGDDTLIEANFVIPASSGYKMAVADVDVSYVNGFSVPITCSCSGKVVTGCNKDLFALGKCDTMNNKNQCKNPLRSEMGATEAAPFLRPCQHAAWTYVNDGGADAWGFCQSGEITCCVGTKCPKNPKQPE